jgi:nucleotide-binding universal stress UspA family protein
MADEVSHTPLIVVGIDGSSMSEAVLQWAAAEARAVHGRMRVVLAWQFPELPGYVPPRVESDLSEAAEKLADNLVGEVLDGLDVETVVQEGGAVRLLLHEAKNADLLVLGSHGHGHEGGKLLGSVTESCIMQAPCPVVVVPVNRVSHA